MTDEHCPNPVVYLRSWPGRDPDLVCAEHAKDTGKMMRALGHPGGIALWPFEDPDASCACTPGRVQEITTG